MTSTFRRRWLRLHRSITARAVEHVAQTQRRGWRDCGSGRLTRSKSAGERPASRPAARPSEIFSGYRPAIRPDMPMVIAVVGRIARTA